MKYRYQEKIKVYPFWLLAKISSYEYDWNECRLENTNAMNVKIPCGRAKQNIEKDWYNSANNINVETYVYIQTYM